MVQLRQISRPSCSLIAALALSLAFGHWMLGRLLLPTATRIAGEESAPSADGGPMVVAEDVQKALLPVGGIVFCWTLVLQSAAAYLILVRFHAESARTRMKSDEQALHRTRDLVRTRDAIIFGLAKLAESRDADTGQHLERISLYATRLAEELRRHPRYRDRVSSKFVRLIGVSSALHDIGKVGIEDSILLKPGSLTADERRRIQSHTSLGADCIHDIETRLGNSNFLQMAHEIAENHHEYWNGGGYPAGLRGEDIPLAARIVAIADVYDALSTRRVYKAAFPHSKCVDVIRAGAGKQFDPHLVDVFLKISPQFYAIAQQYPETTSADLPAPAREPEHRLTPDQEKLLMLTAPQTEARLLQAETV
jgi:HD-GYP domain-containing protein (c-di-GMP phosphodiesterase class II)